jgi:DNA-binding response OmpR family regulator
VGPSFPGARPGGSSAATSPTTTPAEGIAFVTPAASAVVPAEGSPDEDGWMAHRDLLLHPENRLVTIDGQDLDLTRTEFDLLATLLESKRRVRSKADLTLVLRGESYVTSYFVGDADKRAVEAHMTNLRRKLGDSPTNPRYIETVRGVGYRLTSEVA